MYGLFDNFISDTGSLDSGVGTAFVEQKLELSAADPNVAYASSMTTFAPFIKNYYNPGQVMALTIKNRIFYAKVKKTEGSGDLWVTPVIYANPQGLSATLANAQAVASAVNGGGSLQGKKWTSAF